MTDNVTADELRQLIERVEHLEAEKKEIADQVKEVFAEAKGRGYDPKAMREVIKLRARDADDVAEEAMLIELYAQAVGVEVTMPQMPKPLERNVA